MMIIMKCLDEIMEAVRDSKWHSQDEIKKHITISVSKDKLNSILLFLQEHSLIKRDNGNWKITQKGLKYLDLPV